MKLDEQPILRSVVMGGKIRGTGKGRGKAKGRLEIVESWTLEEALQAGHGEELEKVRHALVNIARDALRIGWINGDELVYRRNEAEKTIA